MFSHRNMNFKVHEVVYTHCSVDVENIYTTLWQIYSGQYVENFVRIG